MVINDDPLLSSELPPFALRIREMSIALFMAEHCLSKWSIAQVWENTFIAGNSTSRNQSCSKLNFDRFHNCCRKELGKEWTSRSCRCAEKS